MAGIIKYICGLASAFIALLAPVKSLMICVFVFVTIDFITGVWADRVRKAKAGERWGFESEKARRTVLKLVFIMAGIIMSWMLETELAEIFTFSLSKMFTGFVCGIEFWSYLENAAEISEHPVFRWLRKFMKNKIEKELDTNLDELQNE